MVFVYGALMFLALAGMIVCSKKQKTNPAMQPIAFVLFIVVVIGAIMLLKEMEIFGNSNSSLLSNELKFYSSQGYKVGKYFAKNDAGKKVLFVVEPELVNSENIKGLVEAFSEGYGSNNVVIDTVVLPGNQAEAPMPLYMMMKAKDFDALLEKHPDVQIVVNTIGLPSDLHKMKYWKAKKDARPALFLLGMPSGRIDGLAEAIASGDIAGIVTSNPQAKYDVKAPSDPEEAFDIRYILINKDNVEQNKGNLLN